MTGSAVIEYGGKILGNASGIFVVSPPPVATPTFSPGAGTYNNDQTVTIACITPGSSIYFTTDGSTPTYPITGTTQLYTTAIAVNAPGETVQAVGVAAGYNNSAVGSATYAFTAGTPTYSPSAGTYTVAQSITIASVTSGASIYYTTDGSTPTYPATGTTTLYTGPVSVSTLGTTTLKALAEETNFTTSGVSTAVYVINNQAATPTFSPASGPPPQTVTISTTTSGVSIYYTTDGSTPTYPISGTTVQYTSPITVSVAETVQAIAAGTGYANSNVGSATYGGAVQVINYPTSGFTGSEGVINYLFGGAQGGAQVTNGNMVLFQGSIEHAGGCAWYNVAQQSVTSFTTDFTFSIDTTSPTGMTFCMQNSNLDPGYDGNRASADANGYNYCCYDNGPPNQIPINNSFAIVFGPQSNYGLPSQNQISTSVSCCYWDGGPWNPSVPQQDMLPYGINYSNNHVHSAHVVYDGTLLTMVVKDTVTGAAARLQWTINIPLVVNQNTGWMGFTASGASGSTPSGPIIVYSWAFYTGYNTRLATPTFSLPGGQYTGTQSVTLSCPSGSTCYYSTDGTLPTSSSTQYTGAISITANTILQAVAIQTGYTDSLVATASYQINTANIINYPTGFAASDGVIVGAVAALSGSQILLTNTTTVGGYTNQIGFAWYAVPVPITGSWSTTFQVQSSGTVTSPQGFVFVLQNPPVPAYVSYPVGPPPGTPGGVVSGGQNCFGQIGSGLGYGGIKSSVGISFNSGSNAVGLYTNGATPTGSDTSLTGGVSLTNGHPLNVTLAYSGTTLTITIVDTTNSDTFTHSWTVNISSVVGGNSAYLGFTGSSPSGPAPSINQYINNWTFTP